VYQVLDWKWISKAVVIKQSKKGAEAKKEDTYAQVSSSYGIT